MIQHLCAVGHRGTCAQPRSTACTGVVSAHRTVPRWSFKSNDYIRISLSIFFDLNDLIKRHLIILFKSFFFKSFKSKNILKEILI